MRILHFSTNDKFVPLIKSTFGEAYPDSNIFRILCSPADKLSFLSSDDSTRLVKDGYFYSDEVVADMANADVLILHSMRPQFADAILKADSRLFVVWSGWGFDYSHLIERSLGSLVLSETSGLLRTARINRLFSLADISRRGASLIQKVKGVGGRSSGRSKNIPEALDRISGRINSFSVMPAEEVVVRQMLPELKARFQMIHYFTTEDILSSGISNVCGSDILVGNSATPENNHIEAFLSLAKLDLSGRRVIVPLSYGDVFYAKKVCEMGERILGSNFYPLRDFMPLSKYNEIISSCRWIVMNHRRQQALGNVSTALYQGASVFLRRENPIFDFYSSMGVKVFTIDDIAGSSKFLPSLSENEIKINKEKVESYWSRGRVVDSLRALG